VREEWQAIGQAAGTAVRTLVPRDPFSFLTAKLLRLAESPGPQRASAPMTA